MMPEEIDEGVDRDARILTLHSQGLNPQQIVNRTGYSRFYVDSVFSARDDAGVADDRKIRRSTKKLLVAIADAYPDLVTQDALEMPALGYAR